VKIESAAQGPWQRRASAVDVLELHVLKFSSCWHSSNAFDLVIDAASIKFLIANAVERCMAIHALRQLIWYYSNTL
jgi:hypothetical protein